MSDPFAASYEFSGFAPQRSEEFRRISARQIERLTEAKAMPGDQYWLFIGICLIAILIGSMVPLGIMMVMLAMAGNNYAQVPGTLSQEFLDQWPAAKIFLRAEAGTICIVFAMSSNGCTCNFGLAACPDIRGALVFTAEM